MKLFAIVLLTVPAISNACCNLGHLDRCTNDQVKLLLLQNLTDYEPSAAEALKNDLVRRKASHSAIELLTEVGLAQPHWAELILAELRSPATDKLVRPYATDSLNLSAYFANVYFAQAGELFALEQLNKNYYEYPIPSFAWADTVRLFGKWKYKPASCNIVSTIHAMVLNLADASIASLVQMYDVSEKTIQAFHSTEELQRFFYALIESNNGMQRTCSVAGAPERSTDAGR